MKKLAALLLLNLFAYTHATLLPPSSADYRDLVHEWPGQTGRVWTVVLQQKSTQTSNKSKTTKSKNMQDESLSNQKNADKNCALI